MRDLQVLRWRKYGKDRLYVNDEAGQRVGWVDLLTAQVKIEQPEQADAFNAAVAAHHAGAPMKASDPGVAVALFAHPFHRLGLVRSRRGWTSRTTGRVRGSGSWPRRLKNDPPIT